jgi:hypothetical protein
VEQRRQLERFSPRADSNSALLPYFRTLDPVNSLLPTAMRIDLAPLKTRILECERWPKSIFMLGGCAESI